MAYPPAVKRISASNSGAFDTIIVGAALHAWLGETGSDTTTGSGAKNPSQASGPPVPAAGNRPRPPLFEPAHMATGAANTAAAQTVAALRQRNTERADAVTVRGERIEPGMSADRLFELVSKHDLLGQTMEPDPFNPPNLQFVKYYRIDSQEFAIELRKASSNAPYRVTSVRVARLAVRAGTKR